MNRRNFLALTPGVVATALQTFAELDPTRALLTLPNNGGYGALRPAKARNTGETWLALPEGFEYTALGQAGSKMSDGHATPAAHDGMATFQVGNELRIVRNHEVNAGMGEKGSIFGKAETAYDAQGGGGTTTMIIDPKTRGLVRDFASLNGTLNNCAGGPTPWGTWISCEETTLGREFIKDEQGRVRGGFKEKHGYCFEVSAAADGAMKTQPLTALGRFVHEAIAVDAKSGIVYLTEDRGAAGLYRFIPKRKGKLAEGGKLQMLKVVDRHQADLRMGLKAGQSFAATWVNIDEPDASAAEQRTDAVYQQGFTQGAATFARLEGIWYAGDSLFFTSTSGGDKKLGQVWQYFPQGKEKGSLKLIFESPAEAVLDMPDNLCVSPRGSLVVCEDGHNEQFVRGLTREGQVFDFAKNVAPGFEGMEFAGATFSPDRQTLFVNIQRPGVTLAIWGPWHKGIL